MSIASPSRHRTIRPTVLYRSDPDAPVDPARADATASLFGRREPAFFFGRPPRPPVGDGPRRDDGPRVRGDEPLGDRAPR